MLQRVMGKYYSGRDTVRLVPGVDLAVVRSACDLVSDDGLSQVCASFATARLCFTRDQHKRL